VVVATWVVSRTTGLPAGVYAGLKLPVGFPDALAMALEIVIVIGAAALIIRGGLRHEPRLALPASAGATSAPVPPARRNTRIWSRSWAGSPCSARPRATCSAGAEVELEPPAELHSGEQAIVLFAEHEVGASAPVIMKRGRS
jgi:hypothetical protein